MNQATREMALAHAREEFPREACGLVVKTHAGPETYHPCANTSPDGKTFILSPQDYVKAAERGIITEVFHSHPFGTPQPSQADRVSCEYSAVPWSIVALPQETWGGCVPSGYKAPLEGREFTFGVLDCYALIKDAYQQMLNITLPDFERKDGFWLRGENLYVENFEKAGFRVVSLEAGPKPMDVLLMMLKADLPNHGALYLEGDVILHHVMDRLSTKEVWGGYWRKITTHCLRHESRE